MYHELDTTPEEYAEQKKLKFKRPSDMTYYREIEVPCGKCLGCRLDKANDWATRATLELKEHKESSFITLTYAKAPLNTKGHMTLIKKNVQDFIKRLRKKTSKKLSYILCGEYGPQTHRPHYHAIIFGYFPKDAKLAGISKTQIEFYSSKELEETWGKGYITIEKANYNSIAYVARYTQKKAGLTAEKKEYTGEIEIKEKIDERYGEIYYVKSNKTKINKLDKYDREKEFILSSKNPAIGLRYLQKNKADILRNGGVYLKINDKTVFKPISKYFLKKITAEEKAEYNYNNEKKILENRENIKKRINVDTDKTLNDEKAIKKWHELLEFNLKERARYLKRNQN